MDRSPRAPATPPRVGQRLLDGRQIAIISRFLAGDSDQALDLLRGAAPHEPWEHAVAACLAVLCDPARVWPKGLKNMVVSYRQVIPAPDLALFHTRLALTVIDAAGGTEHLGDPHLAADLIRQTVNFEDGYAAREILAHADRASIATEQQAGQLQQIVQDCGLGSQELPAALKEALDAALTRSGALFTRSPATDSSMAHH